MRLYFSGGDMEEALFKRGFQEPVRIMLSYINNRKKPEPRFRKICRGRKKRRQK